MAWDGRWNALQRAAPHPTLLCTAARTAHTAEDDKDNAALYLRYMAKALEKGEAYVAAELERLTKMSEKPMSGARLPACCALWAPFARHGHCAPRCVVCLGYVHF